MIKLFEKWKLEILCQLKTNLSPVIFLYSQTLMMNNSDFRRAFIVTRSSRTSFSHTTCLCPVGHVRSVFWPWIEQKEIRLFPRILPSKKEILNFYCKTWFTLIFIIPAIYIDQHYLLLMLSYSAHMYLLWLLAMYFYLRHYNFLCCLNEVGLYY